MKEARELSKQFDWVVIDGAPRSSELMAAAIAVADLIIIPVQPSPYDIWACESLIQAVKTRHQLADGSPACAFLVSRAIVGTNLADEIGEALGGYGMRVFKSRTHQRVLYPQSAASGSTVVDIEPSGAAAYEIYELVEEILEWQRNPQCLAPVGQPGLETQLQSS